MTFLAFERTRLGVLRTCLEAAIEDLHSMRCDDMAAAEAMRGIRSAARTLAEVCLPRVRAVLAFTAMDLCVRATSPNGGDVAEAPGYKVMVRSGSWESMTDPEPTVGASSHRRLTFAEVLTAIAGHALVPMEAPLDAHGHAGEHYTSISFTAPNSALIGEGNVTSNVKRFFDFIADGFPLGLRQHDTISIYRVTDARATTVLHVLTAYDRDEGPEIVPGRTAAATVSGYMVISSNQTSIEVSHGMEQEGGDPTVGAVLATETSLYSGTFYPDEEPEFEPVPDGQVGEGDDQWTFTTSAAPMADGWGTWDV
ncbi:MAG: hypothetical protein ABI949_03450 [Ilumatobacteraceae bacterium]